MSFQRSSFAPAGRRLGRPPLLRWWREAGVQVRSALAAAALQALFVIAAGAVLLLALENGLDTRIDASNAATASGIASLVSAETARASSAASSEARQSPDRSDLQEAINVAAQRRSVVQLLNAQGVVIASSADLQGDGALTDLRPAPGKTAVTQVRLRFDEDPYRFWALGGEVDGHRFTVLVGESLGIGESTVHAAAAALVVAGPLLLITVAGATFLFIGRSLRPVTEIRTTVERISHRDLGERVPVPPGRDEVAHLARTMNTMLADLEGATRARQQFVSDASHELRSPIATLRAAADIALTVPDRIDLRGLARLVQGESERLDQLVTDLLLLARVDEQGRRTGPVAESVEAGSAESGDARTTEVDLDDLVTLEARRLRASSRLDLTIRRSPARVLGDPGELSRVLRNLTDNAVRHAASAVSITLHLAAAEQTPGPVPSAGVAVLEVANDGQPIAVADRDRIFDRFVRLEESRARASGGTGLGLAIVQEIVVAHGGTVRVVDPPEGRIGACFRVELPLALPVVVAEAGRHGPV